VVERRSEEHVLQMENESINAQRGRGTYRGRGRSSYRERGKGRSFVNRAAVQCFRCGKQGHYQFECTSDEKKVNYAEFDEEEELLLMAHVDVSNTKESGIWFLDSRCSNHMTGEKSWFVDLDEGFKHSVRLGNNSKMVVQGKGKIRFEVEGIIQVLTDVYYVPNLTNNLLSIGQLQEKNLTIMIKNNVCKIYHYKRRLIMETQMTMNRMFQVYIKKKPTSKNCLKVEEEDIGSLWHRTFGHLNNKSIHIMAKKGMVKGLPSLKEDVKVCTGKATKRKIFKEELVESNREDGTNSCGSMWSNHPNISQWKKLFVRTCR